MCHNYSTHDLIRLLFFPLDTFLLSEVITLVLLFIIFLNIDVSKLDNLNIDCQNNFLRK